VKGLSRRISTDVTVQERQNALAHMLNAVAEDDVGVLCAAARARELDDDKAEAMLALGRDALKDLGWTREELRVAIDARKSAKEAPFYLRMTHERTIMRYRGQEGAPPPTETRVIIPAEEAHQPEEIPALPGADETDH
jgi:hypothetical protein